MKEEMICPFWNSHNALGYVRAFCDKCKKAIGIDKKDLDKYKICYKCGGML